MEKNNQNITQKLEYSTVQFDLNNPTASPLTIEIDTNTLTETPSSNGANAFPNTLGQQIPVGLSFNGIAFDTSRNNLISGNSSRATAVVNTSTGSVIATSTSSVASLRMVYNPINDSVYSIGVDALATQNLVSVLNPLTGAETTTITTPIGSTLVDIVYSTVSDKIYALDSALGFLQIINPTTNTLISSLSLGVGIVVVRMVYCDSNDSIYAFDQFGAIIQVSCATDTVVATIVAGVGFPSFGVFNSVNNQIYYIDAAAGLMRIMDVASNTVLAPTIAGFGAGIVSDMTYSGVTNHIWVLDNGAALVKIIDASVNVVVSSLAVPIAFDGNILYANGINTVYATPRLDATAPYIQQIDASGSQFFIEGSSDFNLFIRDTLVNPKWIDRIMIYAENNSDLLNPLTLGKEDANGIGCSFVKLPNVTAGTNQIQSQIGQLDLEKYIFDVTSKFTYTIPALTTIRWVIYYKELVLSDLLSDKVDIKEFDAYKPKDPDTYDEMYLMETQLRPSFEKNEILNINS